MLGVALEGAWLLPGLAQGLLGGQPARDERGQHQTAQHGADEKVLEVVAQHVERPRRRHVREE